MKRFLMCFGIGISLAGCGGGGASAPEGAPSPATAGTGKVRIALPRAGTARSALTAARSARVVIMWDSSSQETVVDATEPTAQFDDVPVGEATIRVETFHGEDAQGVRTGAGETAVHVVEGEVTEASVQLGRGDLPIATIGTLRFEPNKSRYARGEQLTVVVSAKPTDGCPLLPTPFGMWFTWDGGVGSVRNAVSGDDGDTRFDIEVPKDANKDNVYANVRIGGNGDYSFTTLRKRIPIGL